MLLKLHRAGSIVFIHPFMGGNGRLSRFLIQHCLGQSGRLPPQFLLPISALSASLRGNSVR
jgi:Fic family protein